TLDDDSARSEIAGSRAELERRLGRSVTCFCYPAGRFGPRDANLVRDAGYELAVTTHPGVNGPTTDRATLYRSMVGPEVDSRTFAALLDGRLDTIDPLPRLLRRIGLMRRRAGD